MVEDFRIDQVWSVELEIMDLIDSICRKNKLRYSLFYGTLLGAVRHQGFIPWDDDIDIIMPREDYEKFISLWRNQDHPGYLLQIKDNSPEYQCNFAKIRKDNTAYVMDGIELTLHYHKGIFVDIFPVDRHAQSPLGQRIQFIAAAVNLLFTRGYSSKSGGLLELGEKTLLKLPSVIQKNMRRLSEKLMKRWNGHKDYQYCSFCTIRGAKTYFPSDLFENLIKREFSGRQYLSVKDADKSLRISYGNYWELPPVEERVLKHCPVFVSLTENYKDR